nr:SMC-Scp complex subunit ScpB [Dactylosporangium sucinum]
MVEPPADVVVEPPLDVLAEPPVEAAESLAIDGGEEAAITDAEAPAIDEMPVIDDAEAAVVDDGQEVSAVDVTEESASDLPEVSVVDVAEAGSVDASGGEAADADVLFAVDNLQAPADEPVVMSENELRGAVEAILLIVDEPASEMTLAQVLEQPVDRVRVVLEEISRQYTSMGLGFDLRRVAGGWRLYTRPEYASYVEKFVLDGQQVRLTQAALETLAVVAYKQPVTRSRISAIRGVNCDGVVRTLVTRGLIEEVGSEPESGAFLYRTTTLFLEKLGLDNVDQLPPLAPFLPDDIDEIADAQR